MLSGVYAERFVVCEHRRPEVQRCSLRVGNPILFDFDEFAHCLIVEVYVYIRHAHSVGGAVQTPAVVLCAEHIDMSVVCAIGLQALEYLLRIMKHRRRWVNRQLVIRLDPRVHPALSLFIFHHEHMVGKYFAEAKLRFVRRLCLRSRCKRYLDIHNNPPYKFIYCHTALWRHVRFLSVASPMRSVLARPSVRSVMSAMNASTSPVGTSARMDTTSEKRTSSTLALCRI